MSRTSWYRRGRYPGWVALAILAALLPGAPASAGDPPPFATSSATRYQVTFAARYCDGFDAVMAGTVRAQVGESPLRPGRDSAYHPGQPVDPDVEAANDDGCQPLVGWRFTLGSGHDRKGERSVVTGATATTPPTLAQTPRLDGVGRPTGGDLVGAVTVTLTDEQVRLAVRRQLWAQGGTPDDPLLTAGFGKGYAFGVLRCGVDGHTDGNVQWLGFASGTRHAFCFAYYVRNAPGAGAITVRVRPTGAIGNPQVFPFTSPLSFAGTGFTLTSSGDPAEVTFHRGASPTPYPIQAQLPAGWTVSDLTCAASRPGGGTATSTATADAATARAAVTLAVGDLVTCVFTVAPAPPPAGLTLLVYAQNGTGTFGVTVNGDGGQRSLTAAPADGTAAVATGADLTGLAAGAYQVNVTPPDAAWTLAGVTCNGADVAGTNLGASVTLTAGVPLVCVLRLAHKPGSLQLRVVTAAGVATAGFAVAPADDPAPGWWAAATTTGYGVPAPATGDLAPQLPFGAYLLTPVPPPSTVDGGWKLAAFTCSPGTATAGAALRLTLSAAAPDAVCTASYQLVPTTRLQLVARAEGSADGRTGSAVVEVACQDGSAGRVVLAASGTEQDNLPEPLSFLEPTTCTVTQPSNGAAGGVDVSAVVEPARGDGPLTLPAQLDVARDVAAYTVTVTDRFGAPAGVPHRATLLHSFRVLPAMLIGVGMFTLGALVIAGLVLRRRAAVR